MRKREQKVLCYPNKKKAPFVSHIIREVERNHISMLFEVGVPSFSLIELDSTDHKYNRILNVRRRVCVYLQIMCAMLFVRCFMYGFSSFISFHHISSSSTSKTVLLQKEEYSKELYTKNDGNSEKMRVDDRSLFSSSNLFDDGKLKGNDREKKANESFDNMLLSLTKA